MIEFESFVYLDVPKTWSSFIASVLKKFCTKKWIRKIVHAGVGDNWNPAKRHFISVRAPLINMFLYIRSAAKVKANNSRD